MIRSRFSRIGGLAPLGMLALAISTSRPPAAAAATFTVDRLDDAAAATACNDATPNDCSLRGAIITANASGTNTVNVPAGQYPLSVAVPCAFPTQLFGAQSVTTPSLCLTGNVTLMGAGAAQTIIDGMNSAGVIIVGRDAIVGIQGLTIQHGLRANGPFGGGGGINTSGVLGVTDSAIVNCTSDDSRGGGAIYNTGTLTIQRTTIAGNTATLSGGALSNDSVSPPAVLTLIDSTVSGNTASRGNGGAVHNGSATLTLRNSTVSGNLSGVDGGGFYCNGIAIVTLQNATITANRAEHFDDQNAGLGGGLVNAGQASILLRNTIIAGNSAPAGGPDCLATPQNALSSQGHNLIADTTGCTIGGVTTGNILGQNPVLVALADNGGPTHTHALGAGSPAIDAAHPSAPGTGGSACEVTDQRSSARPVDGDGSGTARCDIGAFEVAVVPTTPTPVVTQSATPSPTGTPVATLTTANATATPSATPTPLGSPVPLGHFMAYRVKVAKTADKFVKFGPVTLGDAAFGVSADYDVVKPVAVAAPADKNGEGSTDPDTYLAAYAIKLAKDSPKFAKRSDLETVNQCGAVVLTATKPVSLLVPTARGLQAPGEHGVDHFVCYQAKTQKKRSDGAVVPTFPKGVQVDVADAFQTRRYDLRRIAWLCDPVSKDGVPIILAGSGKGTPFPIVPAAVRDPAARLVCYQAQIAKNFIPQNGCGPVNAKDKGTTITPAQVKHRKQIGVTISNQFGTSGFDTTKESLLCVRSFGSASAMLKRPR